MIEIEEVPELRAPVLIAAFEGWNDAADAASSAVDHLAEVWHARVVAAIDPEDFYDFQVNRPSVGSERRRHAPDHLAVDPAVGLLAARRRCATSSCCAASSRTCAGGSSAPSCWPRPRSSAPSSWSRSGALLADTPHTRPVPVSGTATEPEIADRLKLEQSNYEGPTGIVGVFQDACDPGRHAGRLVLGGRPALRRAAAVPQGDARAARSGRGPARGEHPARATSPRRPAPGSAASTSSSEEDEEIGDYVRALEETRDTAELPEASGEAIAREFERYLKRRETDTGLTVGRPGCVDVHDARGRGSESAALCALPTAAVRCARASGRPGTFARASRHALGVSRGSVWTPIASWRSADAQGSCDGPAGRTRRLHDERPQRPAAACRSEQDAEAGVEQVADRALAGAVASIVAEPPGGPRVDGGEGRGCVEVVGERGADGVRASSADVVVRRGGGAARQVARRCWAAVRSSSVHSQSER